MEPELFTLTVTDLLFSTNLPFIPAIVETAELLVGVEDKMSPVLLIVRVISPLLIVFPVV